MTSVDELAISSSIASLATSNVLLRRGDLVNASLRKNNRGKNRGHSRCFIDQCGIQKSVHHGLKLGLHRQGLYRFLHKSPEK